MSECFLLFFPLHLQNQFNFFISFCSLSLSLYQKSPWWPSARLWGYLFLRKNKFEAVRVKSVGPVLVLSEGIFLATSWPHPLRRRQFAINSRSRARPVATCLQLRFCLLAVILLTRLHGSIFFDMISPFTSLAKFYISQPHTFKAQLCRECGHRLVQHRSEAVPNDSHIVAALYAAQATSAPADAIMSLQRGDLSSPTVWLGGFTACFPAWLSEHKVARVVNTAKVRGGWRLFCFFCFCFCFCFLF